MKPNHEVIIVQVPPDQIMFLDRIFEGTDGIGIVSTVDAGRGLVLVRVTPETYSDAVEIVKTAPVSARILTDAEIKAL
ncbi:MAG: DUF4911 domain-containing protein [Solirubrobacterales bacterium]